MGRNRGSHINASLTYDGISSAQDTGNGWNSSLNLKTCASWAHDNVRVFLFAVVRVKCICGRQEMCPRLLMYMERHEPMYRSVQASQLHEHAPCERCDPEDDQMSGLRHAQYMPQSPKHQDEERNFCKGFQYVMFRNTPTLQKHTISHSYPPTPNLSMSLFPQS